MAPESRPGLSFVETGDKKRGRNTKKTNAAAINNNAAISAKRNKLT